MKRGIRNNSNRRFTWIICLIILIAVITLSGIDLTAIRANDGIYYRSCAPDTYIEYAAANSFYKDIYDDGGNEENKTKYQVAFWNDSGIGSVESDSLKRRIDTEIIYVCGNSGVIVPDALWIDCDDQELCIIGKKTAWKLFGTTHAEGQIVTHDNKKYTVAGVSQRINELFLVQLTKSNSKEFDRLSIKVDPSADRHAVKRMIESNFNTGVYQENEFVAWLLTILFLLPILIIASIVVYYLIPLEYRPKRLIKVLLVGMSVAVMLCFAGYPADMLPNSWSDFAFWPNMIETKFISINGFIKNHKTDGEMIYLYHVIKCVGGCLISLYIAIILSTKLSRFFSRRDNKLSSDEETRVG